MKRFVWTSFIVLTVVYLSASGLDTVWTRTYGGYGEDAGWCVRPTTNGGFVIAGYIESGGDFDLYLILTDQDGDTVWTLRAGGDNYDEGWSVLEADDGGFVVSSVTKSFGAGREDVYILKIDANGSVAWAKTYGGDDKEEGLCIEKAHDGGYVIVGYTYSFGAGAKDVYVLGIDENGDTLWTRTYGGEDHDRGYSICKTSDGNYVIAGATKSFRNGGYDVYLVKIHPDGDTIWTRTFGGSDYDFGFCVKETSDGGLIVVGYTWSFGSSGDVYLLRTDANGDTLWTRHYGGSELDKARCVCETPDGGFILVGTAYSFGAGVCDVYLIRTDSNGDTFWTQTLGGGDYDGGYWIEQTDDGGYVASGYTESFGSGMTDVYLIKFAGETDVEEDCRELPKCCLELNCIAGKEPSVRFSLPYSDDVRLDVYSPSGRLVRSLFCGHMDMGKHTVVWDLKDNWRISGPLGIYIFRLTTSHCGSRTVKIPVLE